jgi:hypothetical protein
MGLDKFCHCTVMTLKPLGQLQNNLHFTNNLERPSECQDKFYKVRSLLDCIRRRCQEHEVEQHVAVDEHMILFKGRHSCKQYIPNKPSPWALKSCVLCGKSEQPYEFIMYQVSLMELGNGDEAQFGASVVLHLSEWYTPGQQICMDNYFTIYQILELLKTKGMNDAGTIQVNRFNKPALFSDPVMKKKERGYSIKATSLDAMTMLVIHQAIQFNSNVADRVTKNNIYISFL